MKKALLPIGALLALIVILTATWVIRGTYREFIVPQDYVGRLKVVVDQCESTGLRSISLFRNHIRIEFPQNGTLKVKHAKGLHPMAHVEWKYPDGQLLTATRTGPYPGRVRHRGNGGTPTRDGTIYEYEILSESEAAHEEKLSSIIYSGQMVMAFLDTYKKEKGAYPDELDIHTLASERFSDLQLENPWSGEEFDWIYNPSGDDSSPVIYSPFTVNEYNEDDPLVVAGFANRIVKPISVETIEMNTEQDGAGQRR
jgi:hypothetical protein